jgi:hypothetical protein
LKKKKKKRENSLKLFSSHSHFAGLAFAGAARVFLQ